jgi:ATP phosphoribosyltransferase regulatory subunit
MHELRAMTDRLRAVFEGAGYGEVWTPVLEYESTFARVDLAASRPAYRMFDEQGNVLVLRPEMTVPIARLVATRYAHEPPPLRFSYFAHAYRGVRPQRGQSREFLQAGVELLGAPGPAGTAEALSVLCAALDAAGLQTYRVGLGDASLFPSLLHALGINGEPRELILAELAGGDFVGVEREVRALGLQDRDVELLLRVAQTRGGGEVLEDLSETLHDALAGMREVRSLLAPAVGERIIFDLGLVRSLGYYTGAVFQVYDPAHGVPIGSGGRYDELLGTFGRPLPAVGFALNVERLHIALTGEERGRTFGGGMTGT